MPKVPQPLPARVQGAAFAVAGGSPVSPGRARASDLWSPTPGTRLPADRRLLGDRCRAHALTLPAGAVFSDTTAAQLLGLPLPFRPGEELHVTVPHGTRGTRRRDDVVGHSRAIGEHERTEIGGIAVTTPARTFLDLAAVLGLNALVAVGDRIISHRSPMATRHELEQMVRSHPGARGVKTARAALGYLDARAESPKESELRMLLRSAGYDDLAANLEIFGPSGAFVARVDLAIERLRIAIEYEGDHHRERDQWQRDLARRRRLEALGWTYISVTANDLAHPHRLLADVAAAVRHASGRSMPL